MKNLCLRSLIKVIWLTPELAAWQSRRHDGVAISANDAATLQPLLHRLEDTD